MARDHARVNVGIWGDPDFRALPPAAQHLYLVLWTSPGLSYCGVHDWRPSRITGLTAGWTSEHIETVARSLEARHFLVVDRDTEEVLIRSWARFDGLLKQPRLAVAYCYAYAQVASPTIRQVLVHELAKEQDRLPELSCWNDDRVRDVLSHPAVSAKDLPTPEDPFGPGFGDHFGHGFALGLAQTRPDVWASVSVPPTPTPTPTPISEERGARKRATRLPDDFNLDQGQLDASRKIAPGIDLDYELAKFRDYWHAKSGKDATKIDWFATWRNWLRRATEDRGGNVRPLRAAPPRQPDVDPRTGLPPGWTNDVIT